MEAYLEMVASCGKAVLAGQLPDQQLLKALISKTLGYGIVVGASIVKLPQVLNVVSAGSADGLSSTSFEIEQIVILVTLLYSYLRGMPFSAYGEAFLLMAQNCVLLALIYHHTRASKIISGLKIVAFAGAVVAGINGQIPLSYIEPMYDLTAVSLVVARVPQIYKCFQERSTGKISIITTGLNLLGTIARIFTTFADKGGAKMVRNYVIAGLFHFILFAQILVLGDKSKHRRTGGKKEQ